jgi:hypothetical protein
MVEHVDTLIDIVEALELIRVDLLSTGHYRTYKYLGRVIYHLNVIIGWTYAKAC